MTPKVQVPNLVLAQRVVQKMQAAAHHFIEDETGEAMVGLLEPGIHTGGVPTLYVLDTISPDETAVRHFHTFQQGDERQDELIWWLQENWHTRRDHFAQTPAQKKWDVPLRYLGDWHKQPGYMIAPSGGDRMTALDWLDDDENEMEFLLVPIVTLGHPSTTASGEGLSNYINVPQDDGSYMRVDFWFIHRDGRHFQPITPVIYADDQVPSLPPYPWHVIDEARVDLEIGQLEYDKLFVSSAVYWDIDNQIPLEICYILARQGANRLLLIATPADFPKSPPKAFVAPLQSMGADDDTYAMFEKLWDTATPVELPPNFQWKPDLYLIDFVHALEDHLGIERPDIPTADEIVVKDVPTNDNNSDTTAADNADAATTNPNEVKA